jgi:hypothetical protein
MFVTIGSEYHEKIYADYKNEGTRKLRSRDKENEIRE